MTEHSRSLWQFLFSRTGFGRTPWTAFALIVTAVGLMTWYALFSGSDEVGARWVSGLFAVAITVVVARGTVRNFEGKQG